MPGFFSSRKVSFWIWLVALLLSSISAFLMLLGVLMSGSSLTEKAYESGQRVVVSLADGTVDGNFIAQESVPSEMKPKTAEKPEEKIPEAAVERTPATEEKQLPLNEQFGPDEQSGAKPDIIHAVPEKSAAIDSSHQLETTGQPAEEAAVEAESPVETEQAEAVEEAEETSEAPPAAVEEETDSTQEAPGLKDTPPEIVEVVEDDAPVIEAAEVLAADILQRAPGKGMVKKGKFGDIPTISKEGVIPWQFYARKQGWEKDKPWVAVIVTGLGLGKYTTEGAINLPPDFTLSFSPYARDVGIWVPNARSRGHEVLFDLPVETRDYPSTDPGPHALLVHPAEPGANIEALHWVLSRVQGPIGVLAPPDGVFSVDKKILKPVIKDMGKRGLIYVHSNPEVSGVASDTGKSSDVPAPAVDINLDEDITPSAIKVKLAALEKLAVERGYAIGLAQRYPVTIKALAAWEKNLKEKGISLVPVSAIIDDRFQ